MSKKKKSTPLREASRKTSKSSRRIEPPSARTAVETPDSELASPVHQSSNSAAVSSATLQRILSVVIVGHLGALLLALTSNFAPSFLQGELMGYLSPYLTTTHQSYGALPLELTHADAIDFPMHIEIKKTGRDWSSLKLPGFETDVRHSRWPNLARILAIIAQEEPESEILSEIALRLVHVAEQRSSTPISAIRLVQPHVLSFDEDSVVSSGGGALLEDELGAEIVFSAQVVCSADASIGLVPTQTASRTSRFIGDSSLSDATQEETP